MITPVYRITYTYQGKTRSMYVKDESQNITGSIKYRPARYMVQMAYDLKLIDQSTPLVEVTSGNMGIALAKVAKTFGNKMTVYMPKSMSEERRRMITNIGAELVLVKDFEEGFRLAENNKSAYYLRQFENSYNADSYVGMCQELEMKVKSFPAFVSGVGTGGTLMGSGRYLKRKYQTKIIAIEPKESLLLSTGVSHGEHEIQGLSDGFIPKIYQKDLVDQIIPIASEDAIAMTKKINEELKLEVGISSGANFLGCVLSEINDAVSVFPDRCNRYYSTRLYKGTVKSELADSIKLEKIELIK